MKRISFATLLILMSLGLPAIAAGQKITLLHVNDSHSHLTAWGPKDANLEGTIGGLPKAAAIVGAEKENDPAAIFVHSGDFMNGDLFFNEYLGVPELQMLKEMGLDALVLGNRDFQLGPDFLAAAIAAAWGESGGVPILGTNIAAGTHTLGTWIAPSLMKDVHGVKVGLFGLSYKGSLASPKPVVIGPYLHDLAPATVQKLRADGARVVICLTHFGMDRARALARTVAGIDVIVNGHDNAVLPQPETITRPDGGTTYIVSAGNFYHYVGRLRLLVEGDSVAFLDYELIEADAKAAPDPWYKWWVDTLEGGIAERYGDVYHQQIATAPAEISSALNPDRPRRDSALGDVLTDAYRARGGTDVALEAMGVMDDPIPHGAVVAADVFRSMSFGFEAVVVDDQRIVRPLRLVTFSVSGESLKAALEKMLELGGDAFPQVSGIRLLYDSTRPAGSRILPDSFEVAGEVVSPDQVYTVTATKYVYDTLVTLVLSGKTSNVEFLPDLAFDASRAFVQMRGKLVPPPISRIRDVAMMDTDDLIGHGDPSRTVPHSDDARARQ